MLIGVAIFATWDNERRPPFLPEPLHRFAPSFIRAVVGYTGLNQHGRSVPIGFREGISRCFKRIDEEYARYPRPGMLLAG